MEKEGTRAKRLKPTRMEVPYGHNTGWMQMETMQSKNQLDGKDGALCQATDVAILHENRCRERPCSISHAAPSNIHVPNESFLQ